MPNDVGAYILFQYRPMTGENFFVVVPKNRIREGHRPTTRWLTDKERDEEHLLLFTQYDRPLPLCYFVQVNDAEYIAARTHR